MEDGNLGPKILRYGSHTKILALSLAS